MDLSVELEEVVGLMEQVRDPDVEASEYDFPDKIHPAPSKRGNDGLANYISHILVYEDGAEGTKVDREGVKRADELLQDQLGSRQKKRRISNITQDSKNRPGSGDGKESLMDQDTEQKGQSFVLEMFKDFYEATGKREEFNQILKDSDLSFNSSNGNISYEPKSFIIKNGGEIMTTIEEMAEGIEESVDEMYEMLDSLPGEEVYDELRSDLDELKDKAEAAKNDYFEVRGELSATQSELETVYDSLESAHERVEDANEYVDRVATATGHALDDAVSEMESALDEGVNQVDEAQGYMEEILDDDIPEGPDRPPRVEQQLE